MLDCHQTVAGKTEVIHDQFFGRKLKNKQEEFHQKTMLQKKVGPFLKIFSSLNCTAYTSISIYTDFTFYVKDSSTQQEALSLEDA